MCLQETIIHKLFILSFKYYYSFITIVCCYERAHICQVGLVRINGSQLICEYMYDNMLTSALVTFIIQSTCTGILYNDIIQDVFSSCVFVYIYIYIYTNAHTFIYYHISYIVRLKIRYQIICSVWHDEL